MNSIELFLGDDEHRRGRALRKRQAEWEAEVDPLDVEVFDLRVPEHVARAITAVRIGPLLSAARVVVWRGLEVALAADGPRQAQLEAAIPAAHRDVVLLAEGHTPPTKVKGKLQTLLVTACRPLEKALRDAPRQCFNLPAPWDRKGQVELVLAVAAEEGVVLGRDKAEALLDQVGADSARLQSEMVKLAALAAAGQPLTAGTLRRAVHGDKADLAALHRAVVAGDGPRAMVLADQAVAAGIKAGECASVLQREAMATLLVKCTTANDDTMVAGWLGCSPGMLYHRRREWAGMSRKRCEAAMEAALALAEVVTSNRPITVRQLLLRYALTAGI